MSFSIAGLFAVMQLVPQIPQLVNNVVIEVENTLNGVPGITGSAKLAAAEAKINSLLQTAIADAGVLSSVSGILQPLINAAVAMFNAAGLFKKPAATTTAPMA